MGRTLRCVCSLHLIPIRPYVIELMGLAFPTAWNVSSAGYAFGWVNCGGAPCQTLPAINVDYLEPDTLFQGAA